MTFFHQKILNILRAIFVDDFNISDCQEVENATSKWCSKMQYSRLNYMHLKYLIICFRRTFFNYDREEPYMNNLIIK
jgi:hypothetical protein